MWKGELVTHSPASPEACGVAISCAVPTVNIKQYLSPLTQIWPPSLSQTQYSRHIIHQMTSGNQKKLILYPWPVLSKKPYLLIQVRGAWHKRRHTCCLNLSLSLSAVGDYPLLCLTMNSCPFSYHHGYQNLLYTVLFPVASMICSKTQGTAC